MLIACTCNWVGSSWSEVTLHAKLRRIGWGYEEITAAVLNPATLTDCVYLSDWRDIDLVPALIAA